MSAADLLRTIGVEAAKDAAELAIALVREYAEGRGESGEVAVKWARQQLRGQREQTAAAKARAKARTGARG